MPAGVFGGFELIKAPRKARTEAKVENKEAIVVVFVQVYLLIAMNFCV